MGGGLLVLDMTTKVGVGAIALYGDHFGSIGQPICRAYRLIGSYASIMVFQSQLHKNCFIGFRYFCLVLNSSGERNEGLGYSMIVE